MESGPHLFYTPESGASAADSEPPDIPKRLSDQDFRRLHVDSAPVGSVSVYKMEGAPCR